MTTRPDEPTAMPLPVEWPTLLLLIVTHVGWLAAVFVLPDLSVALAIAVTAWFIAQHSSVQHEALHGHPFRTAMWNELLVALPVGLVIPYGRFRDTHLAHHVDADLTDPYDDPESNFLAERDWERRPAFVQALLRVNNTLAGRIVLGPAIGTISFLVGDWRQRREPAVARAWALHAVGLVPVVALIALSAMPVWAYAVAAYAGLGLLKIRTFLEHRAHVLSRGRSVVVEDRGPFALLFLNNNYHAVHHMHPQVPWYRLPSLYRRGRDRVLAMNDGYCYRSYAEVARAFLFRAKDPVPHPLLRRNPDS